MTGGEKDLSSPVFRHANGSDKKGGGGKENRKKNKLGVLGHVDRGRIEGRR